VSQEDLERAIADLRRGMRRLIYGTLMSVIAILVIGIGNVAYSNYLDERSHREARQLEIARADVAEQNRRLVCSLAVAQAEAFKDATSAPGQKSRDAWLALAARFNC
jgi:hypothetical protein